MIINLSPVRSDESLTVIKHGDTLEINGIKFDFSQLPDGASLPAEAIDFQWFEPHSNVERIGGELRLSLILPHGVDPSHPVAFPSPIVLTEDGQVELPR